MRKLLVLMLAAAMLIAPAMAARAQAVMDLGSLVAAIQIGDLNAAVAGVNDANHVYIARVSELAGITTSGEALTRAIARRDRVLRYFRAAIRSAPAAIKALKIHGHRLGQVIYATFTSDRTATLYIDDRRQDFATGCGQIPPKESPMPKLLATSLFVLGIALSGQAAAQESDLNALLAGIGGSDFLKAAERVDVAATVRVVRLSTLAGAMQAAARIDEIADIKSEDLEYLHANLILNPMARSAIRNAGVSIEQIVTLEMPSDGAAVLYADDL